MKTRLPWLCAITFAFFVNVPSIHAQVITSAEIDRGLRYPHSAPYDGEPFTQRYSYGSSASFFLNGSAQNMYYLDYLDRADRAEKFGYRMPVDPFEVPPTVPTYPAVRYGIGFGSGYGIFRRR